MDARILENGTLRIDGARVVYRNFSGEKSSFNPKGDRTFSVVIPDQEIADMLMNDTNEFGVSWKVRIKPPKEEGEKPFIVLKDVKVAFKDDENASSNPHVYVQSGSHRRKLNADTVGMLDRIRVDSVDMDIRPYDGVFEATGIPFRTAYVVSMLVHQSIDDRFADEEHPEE